MPWENGHLPGLRVLSLVFLLIVPLSKATRVNFLGLPLGLLDLELHVALVDVLSLQTIKLVVLSEASDIQDLRIVPAPLCAIADGDGLEPISDLGFGALLQKLAERRHPQTLRPKRRLPRHRHVTQSRPRSRECSSRKWCRWRLSSITMAAPAWVAEAKARRTSATNRRGAPEGSPRTRAQMPTPGCGRRTSAPALHRTHTMVRG
mmetsp:Transcript_103818/g.263663  ORF Transcript_103818/g.263663 Transcript_103818/m.263663 type:complete len:205 (+) Transcript_103818:177-791(+)